MKFSLALAVARLRKYARHWQRICWCLPMLLAIGPVHAAAPNFTGTVARTNGETSIVNLRTQGAIAGSGPIDVRVTGVRVGGILSPLISIVRSLVSGVDNTVCVRVDLLGLDLSFLGVEMDVTLFNAEAPRGVSGRIAVIAGAGDNDVSPQACADAVAQPPVANAGVDRLVADTNSEAGETVALDGSLSTDADGTIASYQWLLGASTVIATGPSPTVALSDGVHVITLRVTDDSGNVAVDTVTITVAAATAGATLTANAGADRTVADTDASVGENVALDASASTAGADAIASYQWLIGGVVVATGVTATVRLPDGENLVTLLVANSTGNNASDSLLVTVNGVATALPIANAGADREMPDTDEIAGEIVALDASASTDADGVIVTYQWLSGGRQIATGVTSNVRLPDGDNIITLLVVDDDGNSAADVVQITVAAAPIIPVLSLLPGLTPNQRSVAVALDSLCPRLRATTQSLSPDQADLLARCSGIIRDSSTAEQYVALDEITPQDLNATRTQTFNLSRSQLANIADRLIALRSGARGMSLAGLNLNSNGDIIPLEQVASGLGKLLGGGASADGEDAGGNLLNDRVGLWLRGNYSFGSKEGDIADHGFDADQWGLMGGLDYRFSPVNIVGIALAYGRSQVDFSPYGSGDLSTRALSGAVYGTMYTQSGMYVDAIVSYLQSDYDSRRHIVFTEGGSPLDVTARGGTGGATIGAAMTVGYDFNIGGFAIAPSAGYNYMLSGINGFREQGAAGLDLEYLEQDYVSATANAGLRMSYAWKTSVAVVMPQVRAEYIQEFIDDTESFGVRFVNDPFADTPLIIVSTDVPDRSYYRLTAGLSAQFRHGISGFVEYQRLENLDLFDYADVAFGLRIETAF